MKQLRLILPTVALAFAVTVLAAGTSFAQELNSANSPSLLAKRIAERFGLNTSEVQEVVDELAAERFAEAQTHVETRLGELVTSGALTQEQMQLILDKMDEWHQERAFDQEALRDMTPQERRELMQQRRDEMQQHHDELVAWLAEQGISSDILPLFEGRMEKHEMRGMFQGTGGPGMHRSQAAE